MKIIPFLFLIVFIISCQTTPRYDSTKKYYADFDIFSLELLDEMDSINLQYPYFTKEEETDSVFMVNYQTSRKGELITIPKNGHTIEIINEIGREMPRYCLVKIKGDTIERYYYDKHPNTFTNMYYAQQNFEPSLHMIIPSFIYIIIKDTSYYFHFDEQFYPIEENNYEGSGINQTISRDSVDVYRVMPFSFNTDSILLNKSPIIRKYTKNEGFEKWQKFHNLSSFY